MQGTCSGTVLGGGGDCSPAGILTNMTISAHNDAYQVTCSPGGGTAWTACAVPGLPVERTASRQLTMGAATCPPGKTVVGGGCTTTSGVILSSAPSTSPVPAWSCWLGIGSATAHCAAEADLGGSVTVRDPPACQPAEILIGGGCQCNAPMRYSRPNGQSWECGCVVGTATSHAICLRPAPP